MPDVGLPFVPTRWVVRSTTSGANAWPLSDSPLDTSVHVCPPSVDRDRTGISCLPASSVWRAGSDRSTDTASTCVRSPSRWNAAPPLVVAYTPPPLYVPASQNRAGSVGSHSIQAGRLTTVVPPPSCTQSFGPAPSAHRPRRAAPATTRSVPGWPDTTPTVPHSDGIPARLPVTVSHCATTGGALDAAVRPGARVAAGDVGGRVSAVVSGPDGRGGSTRLPLPPPPPHPAIATTIAIAAIAPMMGLRHRIAPS